LAPILSRLQVSTDIGGGNFLFDLGEADYSP